MVRHKASFKNCEATKSCSRWNTVTGKEKKRKETTAQAETELPPTHTQCNICTANSTLQPCVLIRLHTLVFFFSFFCFCFCTIFFFCFLRWAEWPVEEGLYFQLVLLGKKPSKLKITLCFKGRRSTGSMLASNWLQGMTRALGAQSRRIPHGIVQEGCRRLIRDAVGHSSWVRVRVCGEHGTLAVVAGTHRRIWWVPYGNLSWHLRWRHLIGWAIMVVILCRKNNMNQTSNIFIIEKELKELFRYCILEGGFTY